MCYLTLPPALPPPSSPVRLTLYSRESVVFAALGKRIPYISHEQRVAWLGAGELHTHTHTRTHARTHTHTCTPLICHNLGLIH